MNFQGILIGLITFVTIGLFHPIVIKCEYHFSKKVWPAFLVAGLVFSVISLSLHHQILSPVSAVVAFTCFWSIGELYEQEKRVEKGWFPKKKGGKND